LKALTFILPHVFDLSARYPQAVPTICFDQVIIDAWAKWFYPMFAVKLFWSAAA
jgi:hypothetical protein